MMNFRRPSGPRPPRKTAAPELPKICAFCVGNHKTIDERDTATLGRFLSSHGKIMPRRRSGVCAFHQRKLAKAIKRARVMSLLPYVM